jgi:hypothetical protein
MSASYTILHQNAPDTSVANFNCERLVYRHSIDCKYVGSEKRDYDSCEAADRNEEIQISISATADWPAPQRQVGRRLSRTSRR